MLTVKAMDRQGTAMTKYQLLYSEAVKGGPVLTLPTTQPTLIASLILRPPLLVGQARTRINIIRSERPYLFLLLSVLLSYVLKLQNA